MLTKFLAGTLLLVLALASCVTAWACWRCRFGGPTVVTAVQGNSVVVENQLLEYSLGFTRLSILDGTTGEPLLVATQDSRRAHTRIELAPSVELQASLTRQGWTVRPGNGLVLVPGAFYDLRLAGNNGFGFQNTSSVRVKMPHPTASSPLGPLAAAA